MSASSPPKDRVELIDGEIVELAPNGSAHSGTTNRLTRLVAQSAADGRVLVSVRSPCASTRSTSRSPT